LTEPELRTREKRVLKFGTEDSEDEDMSEASRCRRRKNKANAKVSSTQHSLKNSDNSYKRRSFRRRTSSSRSQSRGRSTPRSASTKSQPKEAQKKKSEPVSSSKSSSSEDEDTLAKPKYMLKQPKFDGQTSFKTFMAQFPNGTEHNK